MYLPSINLIYNKGLLSSCITVCAIWLLASAQAQKADNSASFEVVSVLTHDDALNRAHDVELQGDLAYVAGKGGSIAIIDVEDPEMPEIIWYRRDQELLADSETVLMTPDRLYLGTKDFHSIDVSNPRSPIIDATIKDRTKIDTINGSVRRLPHIFTASKQGMVTAIDISQEDSPKVVGVLETDEDFEFHFPHDIDLFGRDLVVVDPNGFGIRTGNLALFQVYDEKGTLLPDSEWQLTGRIASENLNGANRVQVYRNHAYVAGSYLPRISQGRALAKGVVVDLSDPTSPKEIASVDFSDVRGPNGLTIAGEVWFLAGGQTVQAYDIRFPSKPRLLASLTSAEAFPTANDNAHDLVYRDGYLYVTGQGDNSFVIIEVVDEEVRKLAEISDSLEVVSVLTHSDALNEAHDVELQGDLAFVAGKGGSVAVLDVADPRDPELVWFRRDEELFSDSETVMLAPDRLFLGTNDFHSIDISNPHSPVIDATIKDRSKIIAINGMVRRNELIFAASKYNFINAFDVSNPPSPTLVGYVDAREKFQLWKPHDIDMLGPYLVVVDPNDFGERPGNLALIRVLDDSGKLLPDSKWKVAGRISGEDLCGANRVQIQGNFAYIGGSYFPRLSNGEALGKGVVVDLSDPSTLRQVASVHFPDVRGPNGLTVHGKVWFLAGGQTIQAYDISDPANPHLLASLTSKEAFPTPDDNAHDLVYRDGYLYVTGQGDHRFVIIEVKDETIRRLASRAPVLGAIRQKRSGI